MQAEHRKRWSLLSNMQPHFLPILAKWLFRYTFNTLGNFESLAQHTSNILLASTTACNGSISGQHRGVSRKGTRGRPLRTRKIPPQLRAGEKKKIKNPPCRRQRLSMKGRLLSTCALSFIVWLLSPIVCVSSVE